MTNNQTCSIEEMLSACGNVTDPLFLYLNIVLTHFPIKAKESDRRTSLDILMVGYNAFEKIGSCG